MIRVILLRTMVDADGKITSPPLFAQIRRTPRALNPTDCHVPSDLGYSPSISILVFVSGRICCLCQLCHEGEERLRLADEKPHVR